MKITSKKSVAAVAVALSVLSAVSIASAQEDGFEKRTEVSILGGVQVLNSNHTSLPDQFLNVPAVAAVTYHLTPVFALEGELTWLIPLEQSIELSSASSQDLRTPDILAYQANVRASWPGAGGPTAVLPYLAGGMGAMTFLSNTDANRLPALDESQTVFALNFGAGLTYGLAPSWGLRADFREFVAFPGQETAGLSSGGEADAIWMERGTLGLSYRF